MGIINQANANKFLGVASLLYAAMCKSDHTLAPVYPAPIK